MRLPKGVAARAGDKAILLGRDGGASLTVFEWALWTGDSPYRPLGCLGTSACASRGTGRP